MTTTEEQSKPRYEKAMKLLSEYKQKAYNVTQRGSVREFDGIEITVSESDIEEQVEHIRSLLAGMGFSIHGNSSTQTIHIQ